MFLFILAGCHRGSMPERVVPGETTAALLGPRRWSQQFGDEQNQYGRAVATDSVGDVVMTGEFRGTIDFRGLCGLLTSQGNTDAFLAKFASTTGQCQWTLPLGRPGATQFGRAVAIDVMNENPTLKDNILLAGDFRGTIDLPGPGPGCGVLSSDGLAADIFLARLGPDGRCRWAKRFGDAASQYGRAVAVDSSGNTVIVGEFFGGV